MALAEKAKGPSVTTRGLPPAVFGILSSFLGAALAPGLAVRGRAGASANVGTEKKRAKDFRLDF